MSNKKTNKVEGDKKPSTTKRKTSNKRKISEEELRWWDALYMYVKNSVFELDPKLNLSQYTIMRLRGMAQGLFVGQDREQCDLTYGYRAVLAAFDKVAPLLRYGLQTMQFKDAQHRINWVFAIVEPHLNEAFKNEEAERKRQEDLMNQSKQAEKEVERYQQIVQSHMDSDFKEEFKPAKAWDIKHKDMW